MFGIYTKYGLSSKYSCNKNCTILNFINRVNFAVRVPTSFMTSGAGVLMLGFGHISHIGKMHYFFKNLLLYSHTQIRQNKYIVMMTKEGSTKIIIFMTPGAGILLLGCGHISIQSKCINCFFENLLLYSYAQIRQTIGYKVMMTKEGSTQPPNPRVRVSDVRAWPYKSHIMNMYNHLLYQYTAH